MLLLFNQPYYFKRPGGEEGESVTYQQKNNPMLLTRSFLLLFFQNPSFLNSKIQSLSPTWKLSFICRKVQKENKPTRNIERPSKRELISSPFIGCYIRNQSVENKENWQFIFYKTQLQCRVWCIIPQKHHVTSEGKGKHHPKFQLWKWGISLGY